MMKRSARKQWQRPEQRRTSGSAGAATTVRRAVIVGKKGKDVDLYSALHAPGTANAHLRHWNWSVRPLFRSPPSLQTQPRQWPNNRHRQHQPAVGLHLRNPSLMDHYSFNGPRRDGWLSWPCWLTDSGSCFTHRVVIRPAVSLAQDRESSPARTGGLTTMLRHQLVV